MFLYLLDLVGVFAFAFYGASKGLRSGFTVLGAFTCAFLVAFGGGTIRELILNSQPAFLHNYMYMYVAVVGAACAMVAGRFHYLLNRPLRIADAVGLAAFAFIGAARADQAGLGIVAMALFAALTAAGGGILCDIITHRKPDALTGDFYVAPALLLGVAYFMLQQHLSPIVIATLLIGTVLLRLAYLMRNRLLHRARTMRRQLVAWLLSINIAPWQ